MFANRGETFVGDGVFVVDSGQDKLMLFIPEEGYHIANVKINGDSIGVTSSYLIKKLIRDLKVEVVYEEDAAMFQIEVQVDENGIVEPSEVVNVNEGEDQLIEFLPKSGFKVLDVIVDGESQGSMQSYFFKNVQIGHQIEVKFIAVEYAYTIHSKAFGSGGIYPEGISGVQKDGSLIFNIQSVKKAELLDVKIDGVSLGSVETYTFTDISSDHTIQAYFTDLDDSSDGITSLDDDKIKSSGCQYVENASPFNLLEILFLLFVLLLLIKAFKNSRKRFGSSR